MQKPTARGALSPGGYINNNTPAPKAWGAAWKAGWKDYKNQRKGKSAVRLCLVEKTGEPHPQSHLNNMNA